MALLNSFETTSPAALSAQRNSLAHLRGERKDLQLVAVIGEMLSGPLRTAQLLLEKLSKEGSATPAGIGHIDHIHGALDAVRNVSVQSQQIARLGGGRLRQSHEKLKLDELLRNTFLERRALLRTHGVELQHTLKPVEVIVDAGLLVGLINAALEWALDMGRLLSVTLDMKNWPEHGILKFQAAGDVAPIEKYCRHACQDGNTLAWYLLVETADVMGVSVNRERSESGSTLTLEFPRTVKRLEGLTAVEFDTGQGHYNRQTKPMAGHRVLVITHDSMLRNDIQDVTRRLGLVIDFVLDGRHGMRFCELDIPHMVIVDERARDPFFDELSEELHKTNPNFPLIEIARESNVLEMAGWMSDSMTRISRDSLRTHLASILAMELAKAS